MSARIIHTGTPPVTPDAWWLGLEACCGRCGTTYQHEAGDAVRLVRQDGVLVTLASWCPVCSWPVWQPVVAPRGVA